MLYINTCVMRTTSLPWRTCASRVRNQAKYYGDRAYEEVEITTAYVGIGTLHNR